MVLGDEKFIVDAHLDLGPKPPKVKTDVKTLWKLILLAKYIVERSRQSGSAGGSG
ncbi:hypothetical protein HK104_002743 [Borealophlyctis nickersoniae]|nr:hypothetical protein HK104_002743 [Borealophlyctis nickersoniae]